MAKSVDIGSVAGRAKLPVDQNNIHWAKRAKGRFLGFRKTADDTGSWWARLRDDAGKQQYLKLGEFDDLPQNKRYSAAGVAADEWFRQVDSGLTTTRTVAVRDACRRHVQAIRADGNEKKADETERRFERYVYDDPLAKVALTKLKKADVEDWRRRLAAIPARVWRRKVDKVKARNRPGTSNEATRPRSPSTVNRDLVCVRAALNRAFDDGLVASDLAWRVALRPTKGAGRRRDIYLDRDERKRLIDAAAPEIRPFLHALAALPLRPGALAALTVGDFDPRRNVLHLGKDKAGADRRITLPAQTSAFLAAQAKSKLPGAPLFADGAGRAWTKVTWNAPIKAAMRVAGLPEAASAYTLRHSTITDLVIGGLDLLTIAQISGTSVAMIEKHYGHLRHEHAAQALAALAL